MNNKISEYTPYIVYSIKKNTIHVFCYHRIIVSILKI